MSLISVCRRVVIAYLLGWLVMIGVFVCTWILDSVDGSAILPNLFEALPFFAGGLIVGYRTGRFGMLHAVVFGLATPCVINALMWPAVILGMVAYEGTGASAPGDYVWVSLFASGAGGIISIMVRWYVHPQPGGTKD